MAEVNSSHLGVIEHVPPRMVTMIRVVELSIIGGNKPQPDNGKYILHLMVDSPDVSLFFQHDPPPSKIEAEFVKKIDDTLIFDVTLERKQYTLQCNETSIYRYTPRSVISEDERDAASLIAANEINSGISPLFVNIHGHGRLWHTQGSNTQTWEVLLIDRIQFLSDIQYTDSSFYTFMSFAFIRLGTLHSKLYIYGHPALAHLAFRLNEPVYRNQRIVWIKGLSIQNIRGMSPMTKNILMLKDITTLLFDNSRVLQSLNASKLEEIDFSLFSFYSLVVESHDFRAAMPIIMPLAILQADITDINCFEICKSALSEVALNYWSQDKSQGIYKLEELLSDEHSLQKIIQGIIHHYNTYKAQPGQTPPTPAIPEIPPATPTPPPPPAPVPAVTPAPQPPQQPIQRLQHFQAFIGVIYPITINQQPVSQYGFPQNFYKYILTSPTQIILGVGDGNPQSFRSDPKITYNYTFATNTVMIAPDGRNFPLTFKFVDGYIMQVMYGGIVEKLDMRWVPPMKIQ